MGVDCLTCRAVWTGYVENVLRWGNLALLRDLERGVLRMYGIPTICGMLPAGLESTLGIDMGAFNIIWTGIRCPSSFLFPRALLL